MFTILSSICHLCRLSYMLFWLPSNRMKEIADKLYLRKSVSRWSRREASPSGTLQWDGLPSAPFTCLIYNETIASSTYVKCLLHYQQKTYYKDHTRNVFMPRMHRCGLLLQMSCIAWSVWLSVLVTRMCPAKMAELFEMSFGADSGKS